MIAENEKYMSEHKNYWIRKMSGNHDKPEIEFPKNNTILDLFHNQVENTPNEIAVVFEENILTYKELNILSNQLSHYLINEQNVTLGDYVAIIQRRTEMLIVSILGILKSGAAYVPIDPDYPQQRIDFVQNDSNCKFTLDQDAIDNFLASKEKSPVNHPPAIIVKPNDLAYIIYTSGSTGNPKGVMIEHRNLLHYLSNVSGYIDTNSSNSGCFAQLSQSFDASILDIFLPLIFGKKLILSAGTGLEIFDDKNLLQYAPYDFINITPSHISIIISVLNKENQPKLTDKYVVGGEALYNYHINQFKSAGIEATIVNEYGPTEATVGCTAYEINTFDDTIYTESIPIGKPFSNTEIFLLDENQQLCPEGEIGEIYIAGNGVARGYLNRKSLTFEKFVPNPFDIGRRMYRTGDLAQWLPDGNLLYCGRIDEQVKVNGHRIELGEIEHSLMLINSIKTAVVLAKNNILIAYIITEENFTKKQDLIQLWRSEIESKLPTFMIPHVFHILEKIPTTQHGKIDRKALLEYKSNWENKLEYTAPRTEEEKIVAAIWKESLNLEQIDIFSNFFEIGGHSLIAVKIMNKLEEETGERLPLASLFKYSTIEKLALLLKEDKKSITWNSLVPIKPNGTKTPLYIVHGAGLNVLIFNALAKNLDEDQPLFALQAKGLNGIDEPLGTIEEIASYYVDSIMNENPHGPYALAGYSFGGIIAYEMAHQFTLREKKVTMVGLLDTDIHPDSYYLNPIRKKIAKILNAFNNYIWVLGKMLTDWQQTKQRIINKKRAFKNKLLEFKHGKEKQYNMNHDNQYKLDMMNIIASNKYHIVPRPYKLDLFRVDEKNFYRHDRATLGWGKVALNGVKVHDIPGNHFELFSPPHDVVSARIIQDVLNERNAELLKL